MVTTGAPPSLRSRHLEIVIRDGGIEISYIPPVTLTFGSALRARDICGRIRSFFKHAHPLMQPNDERISARFGHDAGYVLERIVRKIDLMLDAYSGERLTSKMVEEILGITSAERRRWHKDRRLTHSGMTAFRRGRQSFHLPLYAPDHIARLVANPNTVLRWREQDGARSFSERIPPSVRSD